MAVSTMTLTPVFRVLVAVLLISEATPVRAHSVPDNAQPHIRISDGRLRALFEQGLRSSATLRALVSRLEDSDVVVYLEADMPGLVSFGGRLTFVSVVGGIRYVVVRVAPLASPIQQLGMMGHELQHAVEVAERPAIVDTDSLFREYMRIGYVSGWTGTGVAVDTRAAIDSGERVTEELRSAKLSRGERECLVQKCAETALPAGETYRVGEGSRCCEASRSD